MATAVTTIPKLVSPSKDGSPLRVIVTGGIGLIGHEVINILTGAGANVTIYDLKIPETPEEQNKPNTIHTSNFYSKILRKEQVQFKRGNILDYEQLLAATKDQDAFIHLASYGLDLNADKDLTFKINIEGVQNVIKACKESKVHYLVQTSSYSVLFSGKEKHNMADESTPYPETYIDAYSESKAEGERLVLGANNPDGDDFLLTTCIRPGTVYGPGAYMTLGPIVELAQKGVLGMKLGKGRIPFVYPYDAANAHVLALVKLIEYKKPGNTIPVSSGKTYFVHDGQHRNLIEFCVPLIVAVGAKAPSFDMPLWIARSIAVMLESVFWVFRLVGFKAESPLTRKMIIHATVDRTYSTEAAQRDLGFAPKVTPEEGMNESVAFYTALLKEIEEQKNEAKKRKKWEKNNENGKIWKKMKDLVQISMQLLEYFF